MINNSSKWKILTYDWSSFKDVNEYLQIIPKLNGKQLKRKLPPIDEINYDVEWNERILASIKLNVPESLSSQLNCTEFELQKTADYIWLVTCPFCRSKLKLKVTFDVYNGNRSTNFRKTNFDYHLKRIHNWKLFNFWCNDSYMFQLIEYFCPLHLEMSSFNGYLLNVI